MFSTEDVRDLLQTFAPPKTGIGSLPSLVLSSGGQGLISLHHIQAEFERSMTDEEERTPVSTLSHDLDVTPEIILQLIQHQPHLALLSTDSNYAVTKAERDRITLKLQECLSQTIISKSDFASQHNIHSKSLNHLLTNHYEEILHYDDHVCAKSYDTQIADYVAQDFFERHNNSYTFITPNDCAEMPGSPPRWFVLQHLQRLAASPAYSNKLWIRDEHDSIRVQATNARSKSVETWSHIVRVNDLAYIDLQSLIRKGGLYDSIQDALDDFTASSDFVMIGVFALSKKWFHGYLDAKLAALHYAEDGMLDVLHGFGEKVQKTRDWEGHRRFPESLHGEVQGKAEAYVDEAIARNPGWGYRRFGSVVVVDERYEKEREEMVERAADVAAVQWQRLKDGADTELKFAFPDSADVSAPRKVVQESLSKDKALQRSAEERFWASIAAYESQNEADFATFWTDRVAARVELYTQGLSAIEDTKLRDQLSELLATYIQKDLVPDALARAQTQGYILSRKTKKNASKLEAALSTSIDLSSTQSSLSKFLSKQGIEPPTAQSLDTYKATMVQDMQRRMTKLQKSSDGPVLFLTLVVILLAKNGPGVVYATGKYAPKLLRLLKGKVEGKEYELLETWKEGAKKGALGEEEREGMRRMGGA